VEKQSIFHNMLSLQAVRIACVFSLALSILLQAPPVHAERTMLDLSENEWGLFRDQKAEWIHDVILAPPVDIAALPENPPSCGWDDLPRHIEKYIHLPATVEEHFWSDNGNTEGDGGDYRGVSWFTTSVDIPESSRGRRIFLDFESVYYRAEIFVNRTLVGYDAVSGTPFEVDISDAVRHGDTNEIAVRITDPGGYFTYDIITAVKWGDQFLPASHGFGGITGRVNLRTVDDVYINDVWIRNKPSITEADIVVGTQNLTGGTSEGTFTVTVSPWREPENIVWRHTFKREMGAGDNTHIFPVKAAGVEAWTQESPNLYVASVSYACETTGTADTVTRRFGFRWFDIGEHNGDQRFYLNGTRIVPRSIYLWGFWPVNGIYATREMATRLIDEAHTFGLTMLGAHKSITSPALLEVADEMGMLIRETPGGYWKRQHEPMSEIRRSIRREKLMRMVRRDRSKPSVVIYNFGWSGGNALEPDDLENLKKAHILDPTRIIVNRRQTERNIPGKTAKLFMKPEDQTEYYHGWSSGNDGLRSQGYVDDLYMSPREYHLYTDTKDEIVYRYHQSPLGSPPRLQSIRTYHDSHGEPYGWRSEYFMDWYSALDTFLDRSGFRDFFPTVDDLTMSLGNVPLYHWGRTIENIRMGNVTDYYELMGGMSPQMLNHSGVVDLYANPKGDYEILTPYTRPLYVAVKLRQKVVPVGMNVVADIFLVNEENLTGNCTLTLWREHENGTKSTAQTFDVDIVGGEEYGQLLVEGIEIPVGNAPGYTTVQAQITDRKGATRANGGDRVFSVGIPEFDISANGAVIDSTGVINTFLEETCGTSLPLFNNTLHDLDYIIVGPGNYTHNAVMECVANGATAIVLDNAGTFAEINTSPRTNPIDYRGVVKMGGAGMGGNYIAGRHELLDGLPQGQAFNWEYQCLYERNEEISDLYALRVFNGETIVAAVTDHRKEVFSALNIVPYMRGRMILTTLPVLPNLDNDTPRSIIAKRMLVNFLTYADKL
jgi:beta-galactosidase